MHTVHVSITQTSRILKSNGGTEHQTHKRASEQIYTTINKKQTHRIIEVHYCSCKYIIILATPLLFLQPVFETDSTLEAI